jgi:glycosyltransferase involved in cell wall biosynthesis
LKKISIITATYNSAATIRDTLECVARQTYGNVEHIIVDGKSKDNTLEIVSQYSHVANVVSEKDNGIYDAMNKGIKLATGDIIGILNSDDIYVDKSVLAKVVKAFDDGADACYADLQYVSGNDLNKVIRHWKAGSFNGRSFLMGWMPPHPTFFVRREVYDTVGYFNTTMRSAADYELLLRVFMKHRFNIVYIPEVLVKMRAGGMSNASLKNRLRANNEDRMAWKVNGLKPYFFTLYLKPLRKIFQFIQPKQWLKLR